MNPIERLYYWWWHDYRRRLEPVTYELRRYAERWWWVVVIKLTLAGALCVWLLLFPLSSDSTWVKILCIVIGALVVGFYAWLLLHLGGYARVIYSSLRRLLCGARE